MNASIQILKELQYPNGLFSASKKNVSTGYHLSWIRDNVYASIGLESFDRNAVIKTYRTMLDIFKKFEHKIDRAILSPPLNRQHYLHARYHPETLMEIAQEWGNKQNDMIGAFLFKISELTQKGFNIVRDGNDIRILQKLVYYLVSIEFWRDRDNGMWEESEEIHASSVGACLAGLKKIEKTVFTIPTNQWKIIVPNHAKRKAQEILNALLPRESAAKETDLALLSLIWPYNIVDEKQRSQILKNVESKLVREKGVIRYKNDQYYNNGSEAEWCFGLPWLAIIYREMGNKIKYSHYLEKARSVMNAKEEIPELYFGNSDSHNENIPLGWGQSLYIEASRA